MDPQSQSFTPFNTDPDSWQFESDVARIQQVQAEHSERLSRLERRHDDETRVKNVWGPSSPFPGILSGTPQQAPIQQPSSDHFRGFDDDSNTLMSSLHLDADDEPRRGLGAASRANSVRFDETANQNHFSHSTRPSSEYMSRTSSSGLGGLQLTERSFSHKSEGRASSQHSIRSAASGRASSLVLEHPYGVRDPSRQSPDTFAVAPGLLLLGCTPAIIRCWMNTNFKHDSLLYAAVCTASHKSLLNLRLIRKLGFETCITTNEEGVKMVGLGVYFPEAVVLPSNRPFTPAPRLPSMRVDFHVVDLGIDDDKSIEIFLGSDVLRSHGADILFSIDSMTLFDDYSRKLSMPLVRPESESAFKKLFTSSGAPPLLISEKTEGAAVPACAGAAAVVKDEAYVNGIGLGSSAASASSTTASPPPGKYRPPGLLALETSAVEPSTKAGASISASDSDATRRPDSRQSATTSRPPLSLLSSSRPEAHDQPSTTEVTSQTSTPVRSGSSPAIWSNWRREGTPATTAAAAVSSQPAGMDWASASRNRETSYQRKDTGIRVLKPKVASRAFSTSAASGGPDGKKEEEKETASASTPATAPAPGPATPAPQPKVKANPIGGGSAFSWLNSGGGSGKWNPRDS
ncbi:hypothetical protein BDY17DRAFT_252697 [Neohortaea acidophila]|uniref:Uncharacterized protein n=1 Tax=Neohortaea acidophila TaxID=245834 RepID=A0A6A6PP85_9PEZI|nr:uncharacterized protein BDY17DRAFT_252697 [Neohortaea acidophila]KAF2481616.1 hypothetical protein BDY17DRAFT_252697 [Neohortaea acidophila]